MTLCLSLGIKKATTTVIAHPALVLTPVFSFWTFGPPTSGGCCAYKKAEQRMNLSFRLTWINSLLTLCGTVGVVAIHETFISTYHPWDPYMDGWDSLFHFFLIGTLPLFALAAICLLLIQFLERCSCCCCTCFKENCLPMTEKIVFDTKNPSSY